MFYEEECDLTCHLGNRKMHFIYGGNTLELRRNALTKDRNSLAADLNIMKALSLGGWKFVIYEGNQLISQSLWDRQVGSVVEDIIPASYRV